MSVLSYDIKSHQTRTMQLPLDADGYIPRIKATTDPAKVAVFTMNRHQDELRIYMANPLSTVCQLAVEDKVDKYIKEETLAQTLITDNNIVLTSERDGYNHIYLYNLNGQLMRRWGLEQGSDSGGRGVTDVYGYDEATGDIYYAALNGDPTNQKVYVTHKNGKTDCLTPKDGWNSAIFSRLQVLVMTLERPEHAHRLYLLQQSGQGTHDAHRQQGAEAEVRLLRHGQQGTQRVHHR